MPHWHPAISCGLGHHLHLPRCTRFQLLTYHLFYHQIIAWQPRSTFYVRLLHAFKQSHLPTHNSNFSQNCWGKQHKCSKDNLGWLSNHTPETSLVSNMTSNKLVAKTTETEAAPVSFLNHRTSQPRKTQHHGLKTNGGNFSYWAML